MLRIGQTLITQLVAAGETALQINANGVTVNRLKQKGAPIDWVALGPLPGLMVGVGLVSQAPHPAAARLLVDFLLSREGQQLYQNRPASGREHQSERDPDRARRSCLGRRFRRRFEADERNFFQLNGNFNAITVCPFGPSINSGQALSFVQGFLNRFCRTLDNKDLG